MHNIFVTGASGFVGKALCEDLVCKGYQVTAGFRTLPIIKDTRYIAVSIGDISNDANWSSVLEGIDVIYHTAARVHVMDGKGAHQLDVFRQVNVFGTEQLARAAAKAGVKRLVYLSSIKVNGEETVPPYRFIESNTPNPQDPYAISKHEAEQALFRIASETELEVVVIRPPLIYGAGVKGNFKVLLNVIFKKIPLPFAAVVNKRDFVGIGNLLDAMILCGSHQLAKNQTYLVSDGQSLSTPDLIKRMSQSLGVRNFQFYLPLSLLKFLGKFVQKSDAMRRLTSSLEVDITKIRSDLHWVPPFTVEQGIQSMVD